MHEHISKITIVYNTTKLNRLCFGCLPNAVHVSYCYLSYLNDNIGCQRIKSSAIFNTLNRQISMCYNIPYHTVAHEDWLFI